MYETTLTQVHRAEIRGKKQVGRLMVVGLHIFSFLFIGPDLVFILLLHFLFCT